MDELTLPEPAKGLWRAAGEEMDALLDRLAGAGTPPLRPPRPVTSTP